MNSRMEGTPRVSTSNEAAVASSNIPEMSSRRFALPCQHNNSPNNELLYLGNLSLGNCRNLDGVQHLNYSEGQIFVEVPLRGDVHVYSRIKLPKKPLRRHRFHNLALLACFPSSEKAQRLLQYSADAYTSCGFEMRWSCGGDNELFIFIYLKRSFISKAAITSVAERIRKMVHNGFNHCANTVLSAVHPELTELLTECSDKWFKKPSTRNRENLDIFFRMVRECRLNSPLYELKLCGLNTSLRAFQRDAVNFMVHRELCFKVNHGQLLSSINLPGPEKIRYFPYFGIFIQSCEELSHGEFSGGGILADEMGLGKTVEILALIMCHSPKNIPVPASVKENEQLSFAMMNEDDCDIKTTVSATIEFLKSSVAAASETEYMFPSKKRFFGPERFAHSNRRNNITCEACGVHYGMTEVYWSQSFDRQMKSFTCPYCIEDGNITYGVSATLIVVPESLLHQWYEEIRRHCTEDVRIDIYYGVGHDGYKHPFYLDSYNIILCAYETLQKEIHHIINTPSKELRKRSHPTKKRCPSPLLASNFWRVCLDESQLVKNNVRAASRLCSMLKARYRWCVTGTPLSSSVNDLYGLLYFLGLFPYNIDAVWEHYFFYPYLEYSTTSIISLMGQLLWRNSKKDVADQLENIIRRDRLVELTFTPIEERLYTTRIEKSKAKMQALVDALRFNNQVDMPLSSLPSADVDRMFSIINDVRMSILTGESYKHHKDPALLPNFQIFSPDLIFRKLLEDATTLACQRYRDMIANRNALAGLHLLMGDVVGALKWYQQSYSVHTEQVEFNKLLGLQEEDIQMSAEISEQVGGNNGEDVSETHKRSFSCADASRPCKPLRIDDLQIIHIGQNVELLAKTLENAKEFIENSGIVDLARKSHQRYVRDEAAAVFRVKRRWCEADTAWLDVIREFDLARGSYITMLDGFFDKNSFTKFKKLFPIPSNHGRLDDTAMSSSYLNLFDKDMCAIQEFYTNFRRAVQSMLLPFGPKQEDPYPSVVGDVLPIPQSGLPEFTLMLTCRHNIPKDCRQSNYCTGDTFTKSQSPRFFPLPSVDSCPICEMNAFLLKHASGKQVEGVLCQGRASAEAFIKQLWLSRRKVNIRARPFYKTFHEFFNAADKLVLVGRELATVIQEWVNREREIIVGATRLQLGMEVHFSCSVAPMILDSSRLSIAKDLCFECEHQNAKAVSSSLSVLRYLNTLRRDSQIRSAVRECPCCYQEMSDVWVVFPCAHTICTSCVKRLKCTSTAREMRCVTCRQSCSIDATMYVSEKKHEIIPHVQITVKFEHIIRLLKYLIEDRTNKIIVFTSISAAIPPFWGLLKLLKLPVVMLNRGLKSENLNKFRNSPELRILLLPLRMGSNGLNLTEANHIVFMEPITEVSVFAQAVGRIDRIGQRRAITVHNFVVRGSIEEEIYRIVSRGTEQSKWTLGTLCQVFGFEYQ